MKLRYSEATKPSSCSEISIPKEDGLPQDFDQAKRYYRLCAAAANLDCEVGLGQLLIELPQPARRDSLQAHAWFELAAGHGSEEGKTLYEDSSAILSQADLRWVQKSEPQLERKQ